jgi:spore coat protein U-like protein
MTGRRIACLAAATLALASGAAEAAISCTASSPGFATAYVPSNPGNNVTPGSVTVTCQRNNAGDATNMTYDVAVNQGDNAAGQQNRARIGATANRINYDNWRDASCTMPWSNTVPNRIAGAMVLSGFTPSAVVHPWWGCVPPGQIVAAGVYTDNVTMTVRWAPGAGAPTFDFPVTITNPATCSVSTSPGTVTINYVALGPIVNVSKNFGVTCTNLLPYTMSLDANAGVIVGVQYTLGLSAPGGTGSGVEQVYQVNASAAAGQAGTCVAGACSGSQGRTLTVTY